MFADQIVGRSVITNLRRRNEDGFLDFTQKISCNITNGPLQVANGCSDGKWVRNQVVGH